MRTISTIIVTVIVFAVLNLLLFPTAIMIYRRERDVE